MKNPDLNPARGIAYGLAISIAFWALLFIIVGALNV